MKKRKRVIYPYGSPMAKSLQRWKELWREKPEVMESLRQRGVQKKKNADWRYKVWISDIFEYKVGETEFNPGQLSKIIYAILKDRKENGRRFMKIKSLKRYLVKHKIIKYDIERDLYFNLILIEKQNREAEEQRARKIELEVERVRKEKLRAEEAERKKVEEQRAGEIADQKLQLVKPQPVPKPETSGEKIERLNKPETSGEKIQRLMELLKRRKETLSIAEGDPDPSIVAHFKNQVAETEAEILRLQSLTENPAISS
jgi:hypothetical protein